MKKYISLFSFIALFFVGIQQSSAQDKSERKEYPEAIAKKKTYEMHQLVELSGEQQGSVYKVLVDAEQNIAALNESGSDIVTIQKSKAAIYDLVDSRLRDILSPDQLRTYMASMEKTAVKTTEKKK